MPTMTDETTRLNTIPAWVKELRRRLGWTQKRLMIELDVSFNTVQRWEYGLTRPFPAYRKDLEALGRRVDMPPMPE